MRKFLDISNLVTYQSGKYQGKYDWSNNIGKELYFEYDDISGYIKIIDYIKDIPYGRITLQYKDIITTTHTPALLHLKVPRLFHKEKQKRRYDHEIGDMIYKFNDTYKIGRNICLIFILVSRHISSIKFFTWHLGTKLTKSLPNLNQNRFNDKILIRKQSLKFIIKNSNLSKHIWHISEPLLFIKIYISNGELHINTKSYPSPLLLSPKLKVNVQYIKQKSTYCLFY